MWPNVDELVRILESGIERRGDRGVHHRPQLRRAQRSGSSRRASAGSSSLFGSGMNPGFANLLGLISAGICDRIDKISVLESVDSSGYNSPETEIPIGFTTRSRIPISRRWCARAPRCSRTRCT
jgi:hypothetical protein